MWVFPSLSHHDQFTFRTKDPENSPFYIARLRFSEVLGRAHHQQILLYDSGSHVQTASPPFLALETVMTTFSYRGQEQQHSST
jgi:hypothetical protein